MEDIVDFDLYIKHVNDTIEGNRKKLLDAVKNADVITNRMVDKIIDILTKCAAHQYHPSNI